MDDERTDTKEAAAAAAARSSYRYQGAARFDHRLVAEDEVGELTLNNDQVETVYDLEEHVLVTTEVNEAYSFYKELLREARTSDDPSRGSKSQVAFLRDERLGPVPGEPHAEAHQGQFHRVVHGRQHDGRARRRWSEGGAECDGRTRRGDLLGLQLGRCLRLDGQLLVQRCVYTYGDDILLHNTLLRVV